MVKAWITKYNVTWNLNEEQNAAHLTTTKIENLNTKSGYMARWKREISVNIALKMLFARLGFLDQEVDLER